MEENEEHMKQVLQCLWDNQLYTNMTKCKFFQTEVRYIGHAISGEGITVEPSKIQAIVDCLVPTNMGEVHSFMGLVGYYHIFVQDFLSISQPITSLHRKGKKFVWSDQCEMVFRILKEHLTSAPILAVVDSCMMLWRAQMRHWRVLEQF
ncbi:uncharacterized mitochondrial protein AtMg00860-like [Cryptomeria japonica]|uniref:uncharacterized mitochondrial protein AtMg00860-like n=1 Tax=Cryptomeria japonica TaxID=3369 RepID=UPI0027DA1892|nr:uncharacterized mitochondrial protein AtMg00860-like [Cryptomeria japonica]